MAILALVPADLAWSDVGYRVVDTLRLPGSVHWDYIAVDDATSRLFVTREHSVDVVDGRTGHVLGTIPDLGWAHGIALDQARNRGYVTDGARRDVTVFDMTTFKVVGKVPVGDSPDAIVYDRTADVVFAVNHASHDVTPIVAATGRSLPAIALPDEPEFAVADDSGRLFVNLTNNAAIAVIDTRTNTLAQIWPLGSACVDATGLAIDRSGKRLFATCRNGVMLVLSSTDGRIAATVPIGKFSDAAAVDPGAGTVFSSNQDGTLSVVGRDAAGSYAVRQTVATLPGTRTMAIDVNTHHLYLPSGVVDHVEPPDNARPYPLMVMRAGSFAILVVAN